MWISMATGRIMIKKIAEFEAMLEAAPKTAQIEEIGSGSV